MRLAVLTVLLLCSCSTAVSQGPAIEATVAYGEAAVSSAAAQPSTAVVQPLVPDTISSSMVVPTAAVVTSTASSAQGPTPTDAVGTPVVAAAEPAVVSTTDLPNAGLAESDAAAQGQVLEPTGVQEAAVVVPLLTPPSEPSTDTPEETESPNESSLELPLRKHWRDGGNLLSAAAVTPAAITSVTCKLNALGNVADVFFTRSDGKNTFGCTGNATVLAGGRNVVVDFSDSLVLQVQQGKLTATASGPVSWLAFKTQSSDMRTCGLNVQPSSKSAVMLRWTASGSTAFSNLTLTCASGALRTLASVTFAATMPAFKSIGYGIPVACTPVFAAPAVNTSGTTDSGTCRTWVISTAGQTAAKQNTTNKCPYASAAAQWVQPITKQQLPDLRPPNWVYRNISTAISTSVKNITVPGTTTQIYISASVRHAPIPNVTSAMVYWWFNGNVDGDMVHPTNRKVYPRYLVWHPRDHVSQDTLLPGPTQGSATGAWWSIVEFMVANNAAGYTKTSAAGSWSKNYIAHNSIKVNSLTANTLDMRVEVDGSFPFRLLHTWSNTTVGGRPALQLNSSMTIGLTTSGFTVPYINPVSQKLFGGDCAFRAATAWVQHTVEEFGNFQYFLPQLYRNMTGL